MCWTEPPVSDHDDELPVWVDKQLYYTLAEAMWAGVDISSPRKTTTSPTQGREEAIVDEWSALASVTREGIFEDWPTVPYYEFVQREEVIPLMYTPAADELLW